MITEWFVKVARQNAKRPLPKRWVLLSQFATWCLIALLSAVTIGVGIGKTLWHPGFSLRDPEHWTPFFLLLTGVVSACTLLQRILDGAYQGGECDRSQAGSSQIGED